MLIRFFHYVILYKPMEYIETILNRNAQKGTLKGDKL